MQKFDELFGAPPAYVDGHCHVHQLPGVREPLLEEMTGRYGRAAAVRSTCIAGRKGVKAWIIQELGGRAMRPLIARAALLTNADFAGAYDFTVKVPFERRMEIWLQRLHANGMVMCHPEMPADAPDPRNARQAEYRFLASPAWTDMRNRFNLRLQPFRGNLA